MKRAEDMAVAIVALAVIVTALLGVLGQVPAPLPWDIDPRAALPMVHALKVVSLLAALIALTAFGARARGTAVLDYAGTTALVALVALVARVVNHQSSVVLIGLPDECVALGLGLGVSHLISSDRLRSALRPEPWLHLGVTLLGAEVLLPRMLALGVPGLVVIASVTPIVIVVVWLVGSHVLRVRTNARLLLIGVAAAVGGVSAIMMTSVATRARKTELGFVLATSAIVTVALVHLLPSLATFLELDSYVAGAWLGATLDASSVMRATRSLSDTSSILVGSKLALVQHSMLSFLALVLSVYWLAHQPSDPRTRVASTPWLGVPAAVIGLLFASVVSSFVLLRLLGSDAMNELVSVTSEIRAWCFAVAAAGLGMGLRARSFVLESERGKSLALIAIGVALDAALSLLVAHQVLSRGLAAGAR